MSCADKLHDARAILADVFVERSLAPGDPGLQRLAGQLAATVEAIGRKD